MKNWLTTLQGTVVFLTLAIMLSLMSGIPQSNREPVNSIIDKMPLVENDPFASMASHTAPRVERGRDVWKWIEPGVRIAVTGARGSGTIVYYDENTGYAYVQSCGHLWNGDMSAEEAKRRQPTCTVDLFYKNGEKLRQAQTYPAEVLFYHNNKYGQGGGEWMCQDVSLLRFKPDFEPKFFPVAPADTQVEQGEYLHSIGCDHAEEVGHYSVRVLGENGKEWPDLVTTENSPRPGRSGGGLISDDETYVGICWGTSNYNGTENGYFTPLRTIRYFNEKEGYGWLNEVKTGSFARRIPIVDRNNPQGEYPDDYIPLPKAATLDALDD